MTGLSKIAGLWRKKLYPFTDVKVHIYRQTYMYGHAKWSNYDVLPRKISSPTIDVNGVVSSVF